MTILVTDVQSWLSFLHSLDIYVASVQLYFSMFILVESERSTCLFCFYAPKMFAISESDWTKCLLCRMNIHLHPGVHMKEALLCHNFCCYVITFAQLHLLSSTSDVYFGIERNEYCFMLVSFLRPEDIRNTRVRIVGCDSFRSIWKMAVLCDTSCPVQLLSS